MDYAIQLDEDFDVKVGAHTIHVKIVGSDHASLDDDHGIYLARKYTICLNEKDPYSMRLSTLLHELLHVFEQFYEIKMKHKDINLVGDMLAQVFLDSFKVEKPPTIERKGEGHGTHEEEQVAHSDHD